MLLAKDGIDPIPVDTECGYGRTPLLWAVMSGHKEIVELLLAMDGIDPNRVDDQYGRPPLLWATIKRHKEIVDLLLRKLRETV
jgi:ankyrin repeat protein